MVCPKNISICFQRFLTFSMHGVQSTGEDDDVFESDQRLRHELMDAVLDRRGENNMAGLYERNELQEKQHDKDKFQRCLQRGSSGFLRDMQQARFQRQATRVIGVNALTNEMVVDALSGIGKHPLSRRHALLEVRLKVCLRCSGPRMPV